MPYPESCPECGSTFRNTGTHFTARRNEVGRHVLLELGCQNMSRRFWWDFTTGNVTEDGRPSAARREPLVDTVSANSDGLHPHSNGHAVVSTLELPRTFEAIAGLRDLATDSTNVEPPPVMPQLSNNLETSTSVTNLSAVPESGPAVDGPGPVIESQREQESAAGESVRLLQPETEAERGRVPGHGLTVAQSDCPYLGLSSLGPEGSASLREAFVRQCQLDRLTLRQMRSWLMSEEARRAIEVAAGATDATYERLALILFGTELPQLLGKPAAVPHNTGMSAEDRLEQQREKARIRARLRRAAAKAARAGE